VATQTRQPTGNHTTTGFTGSSGGNQWEDCDEGVAAADDDTTYIFRQDSAANHEFTYTAFSIASSSIASVTIRYRARRTAAGPATVASTIIIGGTRFNGTNNAQAVTYATFEEVMTTNPATLAAWTEADVEGTGANPIQAFGLRGAALSVGEEVRVSAVEIEVSYTAAATSSHYYRLLQRWR
jgi:hypothetical protein